MADDLYPLHGAADAAEHVLMDVASKIQLTPTQHDEAERNYKSLAQWVDAPGSPLENKVRDISPSGSFAIGAPILGQVKKQQHDVDTVISLDLPLNSDPASVLDLLYRSVRREPGSRYYDKVRLNSRCVTVTYEDGRTVDLMPVVRVPFTPSTVSQLFHHKAEAGESYHKEVNPKGFAEKFIDSVALSEAFAKSYRGRRVLLEKAATAPFPAHQELDQKAPRIVALQLLKRSRDIAYRKDDHRGLRSPPSVVLAALAIEVPQGSDRLIDETLLIARHVLARLRTASAAKQCIVVANPAWPADEFTDRWPGTLQNQNVYIRDLAALVTDLERLNSEDMDFDVMRALLQRQFGETAAGFAVEQLGESYGRHRSSGRTAINTAGKLGIVPASMPAVAKRTPFGGDPQ